MMFVVRLEMSLFGFLSIVYSCGKLWDVLMWDQELNKNLDMITSRNLDLGFTPNWLNQSRSNQKHKAKLICKYSLLYSSNWVS